MNEDILNQLGASPEEPREEVKVTEPKKKSNTPLDDEVIASMMANGDNTAGMFTPDEAEVKDTDKDLHEEPDKDAKVKTKGNAKPSTKYADKFKEDMTKNPDKYYIDTPKGQMSIKEAKEQGYDPVTRRFKNKKNNSREDMLAEVNDQDREAMKKLMDPSQLGLAPADAEGMGIKPDSPMVRTPMSQQSPAQAPTPMSPPTSGQPQMPGQSPTGGAPDINALLGGNV